MITRSPWPREKARLSPPDFDLMRNRRAPPSEMVATMAVSRSRAIRSPWGATESSPVRYQPALT